MKALDCPFCGRKIDPSDPDTLYPSGTGWKDSGEGYRHYVSAREVPREQWCYKIICNESSGGCGAEIHGDSPEETLEKWDRRVGLLQTGAWMDEDKDYSIGTKQAYEEFVKKRNYPL